MDYYKFGKDNIEPLVKIMRQRKAGEIAAALNESGNFNDPRMGDPMVQNSIAAQMKASQMSQEMPMELGLKRMKMMEALQNLDLDRKVKEARTNYYNARANKPVSTLKRYTGNAGNIEAYTDDIADLKEQLADAQMNPDPDPDTQAKTISRIQDHLEDKMKNREILRKKLEKDGMQSGGPKVTIKTGDDGKPIQTITGSLEHPETQKILYKDMPLYEAMNAQQLADTEASALQQIQRLGDPKHGAPSINSLGETKQQEIQRLRSGIEGIGVARTKKSTPQPAAQPELAAPKAKPVDRKAGATYQDANGNRAKFLGGDPSDPANYEAL